MLLLCLCAPTLVAAQEGTGEPAPPVAPVADPAVTRAIDAVPITVAPPEGEFTVGDPIPVVVTLALPPTTLFDALDFRDGGRLEFMNREVAEAPNPAGGVDVRVTLNLVAYRAGLHRVGRLVVGLQGPDGVVRDRDVAGFEVQVNSLIANESDPQLRGERDGVAVLYTSYTLAWVFGIGGACVAMGLLGFLIAWRRPREVVLPPPPPPRPAHEIALEKLHAVETDDLLSQGLFMEYYVRVSEAVREYLGNRYGFNGLDMTTEEIRYAMRHYRLPGELGEHFLEHLMNECDMVKFAKYAPASGEQEQALHQAFRLVEITKLVIAPTPDDPTLSQPSPATEPRPDVEEPVVEEPDVEEPDVEEPDVEIDGPPPEGGQP